MSDTKSSALLPPGSALHSIAPAPPVAASVRCRQRIFPCLHLRVGPSRSLRTLVHPRRRPLPLPSNVRRGGRPSALLLFPARLLARWYFPTGGRYLASRSRRELPATAGSLS